MAVISNQEPSPGHGTGFTLIELLIVIGIIALLASIVISNLNNARVRARDARRHTDMQEIQKALSLYVSNHGSYPADLDTLRGEYISLVPQDPLGGGGQCRANYCYARPNNGATFHLGTNIERPADFIPGKGRDCDSTLACNQAGSELCPCDEFPTDFPFDTGFDGRPIEIYDIFP